jgi:hypothetical protein
MVRGGHGTDRLAEVGGAVARERRTGLKPLGSSARRRSGARELTLVLAQAGVLPVSPADGRGSGRLGGADARAHCSSVARRSVLSVTPGIGLLREGPLHAALKTWLARPGDALEVTVDGFVIDLVRADGELVEIQTGGFSALRRKLDALLDRHRIRIVHPIPTERRIVRVDDAGEVLSARRSPKRPGPAVVFERLVSFPTLLTHPHFTLELLLCREDHVRAPAPRRGRRYLRDPGERRLVDVLERIELRRAADAAKLLPELPREFTTRELAELMGVSVRLAGQAAACLRALELTEPAGRRGSAPVHRLR